MSDLAPLADPQISPELAAVIADVVHNGMTFEAACKGNNLSTIAVIAKLDSAHVRKFIKGQQKVRLERARLSTVSALERIRDRDDPKSDSAAVKAALAIEAMAASNDPMAATVAQSSPGVTINIINNPGQAREGQLVQGMTLEHDPHAIEARSAADSINHPDDSPEPAHDRPGGKNGR